MIKRIICLLLVVVLLLCSFAFTAYADTANIGYDLLEFYITWLYNEGQKIDDMLPDELMDYLETMEGAALLAGTGLLQSHLPSGQVGLSTSPITVQSDVLDGLQGRYAAMQVGSNTVNAIYDTLGGYWSDNNAEVRNMSLSDFGLVYYGDILHSRWGYLSGTGKCISYGSDSYITFNPGDIEVGNIYLYNGSIYYPPVLYVSGSNLLYQEGAALPSGYYYILNSSELLYCGNGYPLLSMSLRYTTGDTIDNVTVTYRRDRILTPKIYKGGESYDVNVSADAGYEGLDVLDKITNAVGIHVVVDDNDTSIITAPSDIPYEDDTVVVLVPYDNPGNVIYMSPSEYNTYVDNGDIYNSEDTTNNYVSDETVNNMYDCYNTYITNNYNGSSYDDTNLLNKLDGWFTSVLTKLDEIKDSIGDTVINNIYNTYIDVDPVYVNFSDCFYDNVPAAAEAKQLFNDLCALTDTDLDTDVPTEGGTVTGDTLDLSFNVTFYNPFTDSNTDEYQIINFDWYAPYRLDIRNLLKLSAYVMGFFAILSALKSVFGVHGEG